MNIWQWLAKFFRPRPGRFETALDQHRKAADGLDAAIKEMLER